LKATLQPSCTGTNYTHLSPTAHLPKGHSVYIIRYRFTRVYGAP